ncbi:MAG: cell division protein FtsQ/DivIB [Lachnospiraceae bacterium]|nr:cell division protein FtsQ/DivIB [Lachnospiraceae bacterium]
MKRFGEHMRTRRKRILKNGSLLVLLLILALAGLFVFRVRKVTVSGNSHYSSEQIEEGLLTDFFSKNTLVLWWTYKDGNIPDTMPYLETMKITVNSPFAVTVTVTEKELIGYFDTGSYVYFDDSGVILEITDSVYSDIPVVTGISLGEVTLYQKVPTETSSQLRTILSLLDLLEYQGLSAKEVRFSEESDITVTIGNIDAILGQDEYLEEKVANLRAILDTMTATASGTLHLENVTGKNEDIVFSPSGEIETETETETDLLEGDGTEETTAADTDTATLGGATTDGGAASGSTDDSSGDSGDEGADDSDTSSYSVSSSADVMAFNSSGQLMHHVSIQNGVVVDSSGNAIDGCYVNEDGNIVDAYQNIIDPVTGDALNLQ